MLRKVVPWQMGSATCIASHNVRLVIFFGERCPGSKTCFICNQGSNASRVLYVAAIAAAPWNPRWGSCSGQACSGITAALRNFSGGCSKCVFRLTRLFLHQHFDHVKNNLCFPTSLSRFLCEH